MLWFFFLCEYSCWKCSRKEGNISSTEQQELSILLRVKFTFSTFIVTYAPYGVWKIKEKNSATGIGLSFLKLLTVSNSFIFTGFILFNAYWKLGGGTSLTDYILLTSPWIIIIYKRTCVCKLIRQSRARWGICCHLWEFFKYRWLKKNVEFCILFSILIHFKAFMFIPWATEVVKTPLSIDLCP